MSEKPSSALNARPRTDGRSLDALVVRFQYDESVRRRRLRADHVFRRPASDVRERDHLVGSGQRNRSRPRNRCLRLRTWRRRCRCCCSAGAAGAAVARVSMTPSTSARVIRPPGPVPVRVPGIYRVLVEQPAHNRRQHPVPTVSRVGRCRGNNRRRGRNGSLRRGLRWCLRCGGRRCRGLWRGSWRQRRRRRLCDRSHFGCGGRRLGRWSRGLRRGSRCSGCCPVGYDCEDGADIDGLAFRDADLGEDTTCGRGDFGVDLVGRDLEEGLVSSRSNRRPA